MSTWRDNPVRPIDPRPRYHRQCFALAGVSLVLAALAGCAEQAQRFQDRANAELKKLFEPKKTPQQYMLIAVSSDDADARRDAVAEISASKQYDRDWAIKGFVAIALLESEPQTRCVAIRALARTGDPRATDAALKILNYHDYPPQEVWPPNELCRADAALAIATLAAAGKIPDEQQDPVYQTMLDRLRNDTDRHARIAAARGLAYFPRNDTIPALIAALRDEDFAVAHQCEESLVQLTGITHNANAQAWEEWAAENSADPFAQAGTIPESRRPPYRNGLEKTAYDTRELLRYLWPGTKEE
jgi:HEAT repeat protein